MAHRMNRFKELIKTLPAERQEKIEKRVAELKEEINMQHMIHLEGVKKELLKKHGNGWLYVNKNTYSLEYEIVDDNGDMDRIITVMDRSVFLFSNLWGYDKKEWIA